MEDVLIVAIVFSVPLSAILGGIYLKVQKLRASASPDPRLLQRMAQLEAQNKDLQQRIETLETIVTSTDWDIRRKVQVRVEVPPHAPEATAETVSTPATTSSRTATR